MLETTKQTLRRIEARFTPFYQEMEFASRPFRIVRSLWWNDGTAASFASEILPYFRVLASEPEVVIDAGAATGLFSIALCLRFPEATVYAFEPSVRQRILLRRNLRANKLDARVQVEPMGLWNEEAELSFHTHGAMSSIEQVSMLRAKVAFRETIRVTTLDNWCDQRGLTKIDLVKMDIEGAEIEALAGARRTLARCRPELLIQAYHTRDGAQTFAACEHFLRDLGYLCTEPEPGFLHGQPS